MDFGAPIEVIKEGAFGVTVLMESSTESHGETLLVCKNLFLFMLIFLRWQFWNAFFEGVIILISWLMAADVAVPLCFHGCLVLINMVLNVEHR